MTVQVAYEIAKKEATYPLYNCCEIDDYYVFLFRPKDIIIFGACHFLVNKKTKEVRCCGVPRLMGLGLLDQIERAPPIPLSELQL